MSERAWSMAICNPDGKRLARIDQSSDGEIEFADDFDPEAVYVGTEHDVHVLGVRLMLIEIWNLRQRIESLENSAREKSE